MLSKMFDRSISHAITKLNTFSFPNLSCTHPSTTTIQNYYVRAGGQHGNISVFMLQWKSYGGKKNSSSLAMRPSSVKSFQNSTPNPPKKLLNNWTRQQEYTVTIHYPWPWLPKPLLCLQTLSIDSIFPSTVSETTTSTSPIFNWWRTVRH